MVSYELLNISTSCDSVSVVLTRMATDPNEA